MPSKAPLPSTLNPDLSTDPNPNTNPNSNPDALEGYPNLQAWFARMEAAYPLTLWSEKKCPREEYATMPQMWGEQVPFLKSRIPGCR